MAEPESLAEPESKAASIVPPFKDLSLAEPEFKAAARAGGGRGWGGGGGYVEGAGMAPVVVVLAPIVALWRGRIGRRPPPLHTRLRTCIPVS